MRGLTRLSVIALASLCLSVAAPAQENCKPVRFARGKLAALLQSILNFSFDVRLAGFRRYPRFQARGGRLLLLLVVVPIVLGLNHLLTTAIQTIADAYLGSK